MDFSGYRPAAHVLDHLKGVDFVAVVGPSAVGKTTLMTLAATQNRQVTMILTQTSRTLRPEERDGIDLHFRTQQEMLDRITKSGYVQVAPSLLGDIYATAPEDYPTGGIGLLAVLADAVESFRRLPFRSFKVVFVVPPSWQRWQVQLRSHGFDPHRLAGRLKEAKRSFTFALQDPNIWFVINDDIYTALKDFTTLITGEPFSPRLQADQTRARKIIQTILPKL